jgi:Short-chain dehydrogenases of various substrate specificities
MDLGLTGKLALVSGSTAGIGYAIAEALVREGARVIVNGRTLKSVDAAVAKLNAIAPNSASAFAADLSTAAAASDVARKFPNVEILVNNLGIYEPKGFEEITDDEWKHFFEVNVLSGIRLARAYLPSMQQRNWGRIIFISSESGVQIPPEMIHYGMTKTAQLAVSRGLPSRLPARASPSTACCPDRHARAASKISSTRSPGARERRSRSSRRSSFRRSARRRSSNASPGPKKWRRW